MNKVSIENIEELISPLIGEADNDSFFTKYAGVSHNFNSNDVDIVKNIIVVEILPWWDKFDALKQKAIKDSLAYYLTTNRADFERLFNSNLLPFNAPDNPKIFFIWIWETLFSNESYLIEDLSDYAEL